MFSRMRAQLRKYSQVLSVKYLYFVFTQLYIQSVASTHNTSIYICVIRLYKYILYVIYVIKHEQITKVTQFKLHIIHNRTLLHCVKRVCYNIKWYLSIL